MRKVLFPFLLLLIFLISFVGCSNGYGVTTVELGEQFTLSPGESSKIVKEDLTITFEKVTGDSRCPNNAVCVWAGEAVISITFEKDNVTYPLELKEPGTADKAVEVFMDYTLNFHLEPYPEAGVEVSPDYSLIMSVTK